MFKKMLLTTFLADLSYKSDKLKDLCRLHLVK